MKTSMISAWPATPLRGPCPGRHTYFVCGPDGFAQGVPGLGPFLSRLEPVRSQEQLLDVDESAFSWRNAGAELLGRRMQAIRKRQDICFEFFFQPYFDTVLDDKMEGASTDTQDQARKFRRHPRGRPPAIVLGPEFRWIQGVILMIRPVQEVVDQAVCIESVSAARFMLDRRPEVPVYRFSGTNATAA